MAASPFKQAMSGNSAVADKVQARYERAGGRSALPWAIIIQAVIALLPAICPAAMKKRWAKRNPEAAKEAIANALKSEDGPRMSGKDLKLVVDAAYEEFCKMSNDDINSFS